MSAKDDRIKALKSDLAALLAEHVVLQRSLDVAWDRYYALQEANTNMAVKLTVARSANPHDARIAHLVSILGGWRAHYTSVQGQRFVGSHKNPNVALRRAKRAARRYEKAHKGLVS